MGAWRRRVPPWVPPPPPPPKQPSTPPPPGSSATSPSSYICIETALWPPSLAPLRVSEARAPMWAARTDVSVFLAGSRRRGTNGYFIPAEVLCAMHPALAWRVPGRPWPGVVGGPVPRPPEPTPPGFRHQQAPFPPGAISRPPGYVGCYLSAWHGRLGPILGPCAMTGPRAMRGAERAHDPRHLQARPNLADHAGAPIVL